MLFRTVSLSAALVVAASLPALAQNPRIDQRQYNQDQRIERGYQRGDITPREARRLELEQRRIDRMQRRAMADGRMTRRERREIEVAQNRLNRMIRHERRDAQYR